MKVQTILMDMQFDKTANNLTENVVVNTSTAKEHVMEIERCICTIKEHIRDVVTTLPFDYLPKLIVVNLDYFIVMCLNAFLANNGVSDKFSPQALVTRTNPHRK